MTRTHRLTAAFLVLAAAGPALGQAPPADAAKPVTVPFTLLPSRHMVIEAAVNGKGPYKFVFDTGAPINLVSGKVAKDANLSAPKLGGLGLLFGGPRQAKADRLTVGGVTAEAVPVMVMDHPTVTAISNAFKDEVGSLQGIIGFPFFARYALTLDYQTKEMTLTPTGYKPGDYLADLTGRLTAAAAGGSAPKVFAPAGLWGLTVEKPADDAAAGVVVRSVSAGGPADKGGLKTGDRLLTLDGRWTDSAADVALAAGFVKPGRAAEVVFTRGGREMTVTVTPVDGL